MKHQGTTQQQTLTRGDTGRTRIVGVVGSIVAAALTIMALAVPPTASALTTSFSCWLAQDTWCDNYPNNHSYAYSRAYWNGISIPMCAKITNINGADNGTRNCASGVYVYSFLQPGYVGPNTYAWVANGHSTTTKTISAFANTDPY